MPSSAQLVRRYSAYAHLIEERDAAAALRRAHRDSAPFLPRYLHFITTYRCNLRCAMCSTWKRRVQPELSADVLGHLFSSRLFSQIRVIKLTGGELFQRSDWRAIVELVTEMFPRAPLSIATNGIPSARLRAAIHDLCSMRDQIEVSISLDGFGEYHDAVRGCRGAFEETMRSIHHALDAREQYEGMTVRLSYTMTAYNASQFDRVCAFAGNHNMYIGYRLSDSGALYNRAEAPTVSTASRERLLGQLAARADNAFKRYLPEWMRSRHKPLPCYALFTTLYLDPYGNVHTCPRRGRVASLMDDDPLRIWNALGEQRRKIKYCSDCYTDCQAIPDMLIEGSLLKRRKAEGVCA